MKICDSQNYVSLPEGASEELLSCPTGWYGGLKCLADHKMVVNSSWVSLPNVSTHLDYSDQTFEQQIGEMIPFSNKIRHFAMIALTKKIQSPNLIRNCMLFLKSPSITGTVSSGLCSPGSQATNIGLLKTSET